MKKFPIFVILLAANLCGSATPSENWEKHTVMSAGANTTAVASDYTGDGLQDVITSYLGRVSLFIAPDWDEVVLHRFGDQKSRCIHSTSFDVDDDGDPDWIGSLAHDAPFWLENPGATDGAWAARIVDPDIRGIHCILEADVDNDGRLDVIINNFLPEGMLGDSCAWFSRPKNVRKANQWDRHVFADKSARGGSHYFGFGDVDGDGWGEIAVGAKGAPFEDGNWFAYWKNPGKQMVRGAWDKVVLAENQLAATNILPGDLNGDGVTDFLASRGHSAGVIWFEGPSWTIHEIDLDMKSPHSLVLADLDGDGDLDGATCGYESERVAWYENDSLGDFTIHILDEAQQSYDLRAVDMDGDGDLDLLNAGRATGNVVWYQNPAQP
ncbi:MAG: VCBS repeat-containing protein [Verrucomicrobiota bacterium]